jgi:hypothetical protein
MISLICFHFRLSRRQVYGKRTKEAWILRTVKEAVKVVVTVSSEPGARSQWEILYRTIMWASSAQSNLFKFFYKGPLMFWLWWYFMATYAAGERIDLWIILMCSFLHPSCIKWITGRMAIYQSFRPCWYGLYFADIDYRWEGTQSSTLHSVWKIVDLMGFTRKYAWVLLFVHNVL